MHTDFFLSQVGPLLRTERTGQGCTGHLASLWGRDPSAGHQISELMGNTGQHSHLLIRTCRNSSLSSVPGGWPHSLASQVIVMLVCAEPGLMDQYPVTRGDRGYRQRQRQHLTPRGDTQPRLGITLPHWAWHIDTAANNPSRYYYMRAKYGLWLWQGLERASKNAPTTQS